MKCYNCGAELSESGFCNACGVDVGLYKRIVWTSNRYYNEGLEKARVRDLSGAKESLRLSLKCYKYNTEARNLLGLVCFEMGEAVEAISEWVISKNLQPDKNIADVFMDSLQNNQSKWEAIGQTITKYNKALEYCGQDSLDMAVIQLKSLLKINPNMVKGHQLLALLYMKNEEWEKAQRCVERARLIDTNNTTTLLYAKEITEALMRRDEMDPEAAAKRKKRDRHKDVIEYTVGNETIIQPLNHPEKSAVTTTVINIAIGLLIGLGIMWYLVVPARTKAAKNEANDEVVDVSEQLTEKTARIDELEKRLDAVSLENSQLKDQVQGFTGTDGVSGATETLMRAAAMYIEDRENVIQVAQEVSSIDPEYAQGEDSGDAFKLVYTILKSEACERASKEYTESGLESLREDDYPDAIEKLSKAFEFDNTNAEALYNLAHAYRRAGETGRANDTYGQVIALFEGSEYADSAREYVNVDELAATEETAPEETQEEAPAEVDEGNGDEITLTPVDESAGEVQAPAGNPDGQPAMVLEE